MEVDDIVKVLALKDHIKGKKAEGNHLYAIKYMDNYNHYLMQDLIFGKDIFEALEDFKTEHSNMDYSIIEASFYQW